MEKNLPLPLLFLLFPLFPCPLFFPGAVFMPFVSWSQEPVYRHPIPAVRPLACRTQGPASRPGHKGGRLLIPVLLLATLFGVPLVPANQSLAAQVAAAQGTEQGKEMEMGKQGSDGFARVFRTVSLRRPMKLFPFWTKALARDRQNPIFLEDKVLRGKKTWKDLQGEVKEKSGLELARAVNRFWNAFPYIEDIRNWKKQDYWAAPYEFLKKSGDCEDYVIVKYLTLRQLGVAARDMRILVVNDTFRGLAHAVLGVNVGGTVYILDNVSNAILSHDKLGQYRPQFSVNEDNAWMHVRGKKK